MSVKIDSTEYFSDYLVPQLRDRAKYTTDVGYLNQFKNHFVFIYGTLRKGNSRNEVLKKQEYCGPCVTKESNFDLLLYPNGRYPVAFENISKDRNHQLKGELWLVSSSKLIDLDCIERNGVLFERKWINVYIGKEIVPCFIYIGIKNAWKYAELLDMPCIIHNKQKYHSYHEGIASKIIDASNKESNIS